ncbi:MAG: YdiU family protein [Deltaproteobacteria bacterium]|nr:YdiU family protein [Deltaproteobacteria bacterium]
MPEALFPFDNSYARLPEHFFARLPPTPVSEPGLVELNEDLARHLGLDPEQLRSPESIEILAGNRVPAGAEPLAMAYAGFQFGGWVPQLGDGRAILLGELIDRDGVRRDIQLKGSGRTPFSRNGDGRAGLGPVLREYIVSEAMARLGIATTRSLAAVTTGEEIVRETQLPGAILTRVARSHVRVGTFQYFAARGDVESLSVLAGHVIARHYPEAAREDNPYLALLAAVIERQAVLIASWQHVGFIHGVMNTDNTSIAGETIDYGPCAFMDDYHPDTVYSSIDQRGRYAYGNQPSMAQWNLVGFAQTLVPLVDDDEETSVALINEIMPTYASHFEAEYFEGMGRKLGLAETRDGDPALVVDLLTRMADHKADYTLTFRGLCQAAGGDPAATEEVGALFEDPGAFQEWAARWRERLAAESTPASVRESQMRAVNPAYIPRNHFIEAVIVAAVEERDFGPFRRLIEVLDSPFEERPGSERYAAPPRPEEVVHATFCGT